jgi:hypothetical protein
VRIYKKDILSIGLIGGEMRATVGNSATDEGQVPDATFWGLDGFYSKPKPPDDDGACMGLYVHTGHTARVLATKDNRIVEKYGELSDGDRAIVGYRSARFIIKDGSDSVTMMTENHASNDELMLVQINGEKGELTAIIGDGAGAAVLKLKGGIFHVSVAGGAASLTLDKDGLHVTGNVCDLATAGGNLGVMGAIPPPPGNNSILKGPQGQVGTPSTFWTIA